MKSLLDSIWAPEEDNNEIVIQIKYYCISINCGGGDDTYHPPGNFTCIGGGDVDYLATSICR